MADLDILRPGAPVRFISGLSNCHLPGLYSLVLSERQTPKIGMRRIFYCGPNCTMDLWAGADFRLKPHNHRQNLRLTLLFGQAKNVSLKIGFGIHRAWCYRFGSALLNGSFELDRLFFQDVDVAPKPITREGVDLHWSDVHTMTAQPGSAWLVEEGELAPPDTARCWSIDHQLKLSNEGLYLPMEAKQLGSLERFVEENLCLRLT